MRLEPGEPLAAPWRVLTRSDFVELILNTREVPDNRPRVLAVDGRSGSGKSTIADLLHRSVPHSMIVHTDDIAWHHSFFNWSDLLIEGILKPLHSGKAVNYQPPGWQTHGRSGAIKIIAGLALVIIEGVGASRTEAMPWIDSSVWVQSDLDEAERRGIARDGGTEEARKFWHEWMSQEFAFLQQHRPWERATAIVNGTPTQSYDRNRQVVVSAMLPKQADDAEEKQPD